MNTRLDNGGEGGRLAKQQRRFEEHAARKAAKKAGRFFPSPEPITVTQMIMQQRDTMKAKRHARYLRGTESGPGVPAKKKTYLPIVRLLQAFGARIKT